MKKQKAGIQAFSTFMKKNYSRSQQVLTQDISS